MIRYPCLDNRMETIMRKPNWLPVVAALSVLSPLALVGSPGRASAQAAPGQAPPTVSKPVEAKTLLNAAYKQAKKERKPVLVMFHATW